MPSETFFKLDSAKQKRVYEAGIEEFCRVPFEEVSIRNIVNSASIARGSFYQYFEDKEDLFLYIVSNIRRAEMKRIQSAPMNIFEFISTIAKKQLDVIDVHPDDLSDKAKILHNTAKSPIALMLLDKQVENDLKTNPLVKELLEKSNLANISEEQRNAFMDLMSHTMKTAIIEVLNQSKTVDESLNNFNIKLEIIKSGIFNQ
ncbi:TetR family transcriptional regulator [Vallitalea okinawensis]|uniref:TetR family transcriptional regulator n=1 Tax=Vallitalea okinawensis TaxID=2078660 RepID=UPI000CFBA95B|nr:TetR family transcriptional regulator [Vallitalea okinawensis]